MCEGDLEGAGPARDNETGPSVATCDLHALNLCKLGGSAVAESSLVVHPDGAVDCHEGNSKDGQECQHVGHCNEVHADFLMMLDENKTR